MANMALCASLCNMATIHKNKEGNWQANGDATEIALQVFAHKLGRGKPHMTHPRRPAHSGRAPSQVPPAMQRTSSTYSANEKAVPLDGHYKLVVEHPFDSTVKRMSTAWRFVKEDGTENDKECLVFMKGAVERVLDRCDAIGLGNDSVPMDETRKAEIIARMDAVSSPDTRSCFQQLILSRLIYLSSPPRVFEFFVCLVKSYTNPLTRSKRFPETSWSKASDSWVLLVYTIRHDRKAEEPYLKPPRPVSRHECSLVTTLRPPLQSPRQSQFYVTIIPKEPS